MNLKRQQGSAKRPHGSSRIRVRHFGEFPGGIRYSTIQIISESMVIIFDDGLAEVASTEILSLSGFFSFFRRGTLGLQKRIYPFEFVTVANWL
jgi:hypothetical protein